MDAFALLAKSDLPSSVYGMPLWIALAIVIVGLLLIRTAITLVKVLVIVAIAVAVYLGVMWLVRQMG